MVNKPVYIYVTPFFASMECWSGTYGYDFLHAVQQSGRYDVAAFVEGDGPDYVYGGIRVLRFKARRLPSNILPFLFENLNQRCFLRSVERAGFAFSNIAVCHANTANYVSYALALKARNRSCTTLLHHHCLQSFGLNMGALAHCWPYNLFMFPAFRKRFERIDKHVFISQAVKRSFLSAPDTHWSDFPYYKKQMRGLPYRPVRISQAMILHNGADASIFHPCSQPQTPNSTFTIGCIGHFSELKDQMSLIRAVEILGRESPERKILVRFVGSGDLREVCKSYIAAHFNGFHGFESFEAYIRKDHFVEFTGDVRCSCGNVTFEFICEVRHDQLPAFYRSLDLFVLPSVFEGLGCVYAEAWACGVPFIACKGQGTDDWIAEADRHLWLCDKNNPVNLASKIRQYWKHPVRQVLAEDIEINHLVGRFLEDLK